MNNLFKVILLCAILSNTFTPCFPNETKPYTQTTFTPLTLTNTVADKLARLPIADPVEFANNDETGVLEKLETETPSFISESEQNLPPTQSNMASDVENVYNEDEQQMMLVGDNRIAVCPVNNDVFTRRVGTVEDFKEAYRCLDGKELTAIVLEKGRKFEVKSLQPLSYDSATGTEVTFESIYPERVFLSKDPSKIFFKGEVIKNKPPRKGGGSGTIKVQIKGMQIENVTYPAEAYISKMNKKGVLFGSVSVPSIYKDNLSNTVNNGVINNYHNFDPCNVVAQECVNNAVKPFYFLTGAALQTADLFLAPLIAFFATGNEIYIPEGTEFEIKLEDSVPVLEL